MDGPGMPSQEGRVSDMPVAGQLLRPSGDLGLTTLKKGSNPPTGGVEVGLQPEQRGWENHSRIRSAAPQTAVPANQMNAQCVWHPGGQETDHYHLRPEGDSEQVEHLWRPALLNNPWRLGVEQPQRSSGCDKGREKGDKSSAMAFNPVPSQPASAKHIPALPTFPSGASPTVPKVILVVGLKRRNSGP